VAGEQLKTFGEIMGEIEKDIQAVRDGTLDPQKARVINSLRGRTFQGLELYLRVVRFRRGGDSKGVVSGAATPLLPDFT